MTAILPAAPFPFAVSLVETALVRTAKAPGGRDAGYWRNGSGLQGQEAGAELAVWYLYLIECEDGSLYAGIALDVAQRFAAHVNGKGARYTRSHKPVRLVGFRACGSRSDALKAELAIKRLPKSKKVAALLALPDRTA